MGCTNKTVHPLNQMSPQPTIHDSFRRRGADAEFGGEVNSSDALSFKAPEFYNLGVGKFGASVRFAVVGFVTLFKRHISHVVEMRSQEQVINPDAMRNVALVTHEHSFRNWAIGKLPCEPMNPNPSTVNQCAGMSHVPSACFLRSRPEVAVSYLWNVLRNRAIGVCLVSKALRRISVTKFLGATIRAANLLSVFVLEKCATAHTLKLIHRNLFFLCFERVLESLPTPSICLKVSK